MSGAAWVWRRANSTALDEGVYSSTTSSALSAFEKLGRGEVSRKELEKLVPDMEFDDDVLRHIAVESKVIDAII